MSVSACERWHTLAAGKRLSNRGLVSMDAELLYTNELLLSWTYQMILETTLEGFTPCLT